MNVVQPIAMKPRILIVEDEEPLALLLRYNLENEGYSVDTVGRGEEAELKLRENLPDLVILDWMLPGTSGIEICRRLRARQGSDKLPILMLTARGEESERVRGLATGADDYVVKPFSVPELIARVNALLRRAKPGAVASLLKIGDLELDREKRRVHRAGRELALGPTEFRLARIPDVEPGARVLARAIARRRLGPRDLRRRAHGRRSRRAAAQGDQPRPRARPDPHRARLGLFVRRALRSELSYPPARMARRSRRRSASG